MTFRDFVELVRDGVESVAFTLEGDRDLTPMLHLESEHGIESVPVDPGFFQSSDAARRLAHLYLVPLIGESHARKVAWTFCAWQAPVGERPSEHPNRREILFASFIDAERVEHWAAPIVRTGDQVMVGNWQSAVPNLGGGPMWQTIQEALR